MTTLRWETRCDGDGCAARVLHGDSNWAALIYCPVCERDLCAECAKATGHQQTVWPDVDQAPELSCDPDDFDPDYVNSPTDHWRMREAR